MTVPKFNYDRTEYHRGRRVDGDETKKLLVHRRHYHMETYRQGKKMGPNYSPQVDIHMVMPTVVENTLPLCVLQVQQ